MKIIENFYRSFFINELFKFKNKTGITDEQVNWIIETVAHLIDNGLQMIHEGNFKIDPKVISGKSKCKFCPYSAICYKNYHDYIYINPKGGNK